MTVKLKVYCGFNVYYTSNVFEEPDECCWESIVEVDEEDWEDGCVLVNCGNCGAELTQYMDHFEEIK